MKRITAIIIILCIVVSIAACATENADEADTSASNNEVTSAVESTQLQPDIPDVTFDGADFSFLSREVTDTVVRFYSEVSCDEQNGEIMNDTVYDRTVRIEEKYNVNIVDETAKSVSATFRKSYLANEANWNVVIDAFMEALAMVTAGYTADLTSIEYIDLSKPWWDSRVAEDMMIRNQVYSAIGAMNTWTDSHTYAIIFNKELAKNYNLDPYSMVRSNEWTLDNFNQIIAKVTGDIDGNGEMDENDRYGAVGENFNFTLHMLGSDIILIGHDEDGLFKINIDDRFFTVASKVSDMMLSGNYLIAEDYMSKYSDPWTDVLRKCFRSGNALFYVGGVEQMLIFRDLETDIGLLPMMKYDENQEDFAHSFSTYWSSTIYVPRNLSNTEMTGILLEAINADSYYSVAKAYYEVVLKGKAMRDLDSCEMIDIIRSSRTIDPEQAYGFLGINEIYYNILKNRSTEGFASKIEAVRSSAQTKIDKTLAKMQ